MVAYYVKMSKLQAILIFASAIIGTSEGTQVRLVGGATPHEGRVEVLHGGEWGTICDDSWGLAEANVICSWLDYGGADAAHSEAHFGEGSGPILLDNVHCAGTESDIAECKHSGWGVHDCGHTEDVSVSCTVAATTVRLVNGGSPNQGRVEIFHNGQWGTICDDFWDPGDAGVVCKMLGYDFAVAAPRGAAFGEGTGPIWLDDVDCSGGGITSLKQCKHAGWAQSNCKHEEDAGVVCSRSFRLVGGADPSQGVVQVYGPGGIWGTICNDSAWGIEAANVVCKNLGFPGAKSAYGNFPSSVPNIWLSGVTCSGFETSPFRCSFVVQSDNTCPGGVGNVSISCHTGDTVKLVGGSGPHEGRVEVLHQIRNETTWGTVCDAGWDLVDANVVCNMLGYDSAFAAPGGAVFGPGTGPVWLSDVQCNGNELTLTKCAFSSWLVPDCNHTNDASVICKIEEGALRLIQGNLENEGLVQIMHEGSWGTICNKGWEMKDADVVCRQLGFPGAAAVATNEKYGPGYGPVWLVDVGCEGSEDGILDCTLGDWGSTGCTHADDAAVICEIVDACLGTCSGAKPHCCNDLGHPYCCFILPTTAAPNTTTAESRSVRPDSFAMLVPLVTAIIMNIYSAMATQT